MQLFVSWRHATRTVDVCKETTVEMLKFQVQEFFGVPSSQQRLTVASKQLEDGRTLSDYNLLDASTLQLHLRLRGGIDFQHRAGSKPGSGGVASEQQVGCTALPTLVDVYV